MGRFLGEEPGVRNQHIPHTIVVPEIIGGGGGFEVIGGCAVLEGICEQLHF